MTFLDLLSDYVNRALTAEYWNLSSRSEVSTAYPTDINEREILQSFRAAKITEKIATDIAEREVAKVRPALRAIAKSYDELNNELVEDHLKFLDEFEKMSPEEQAEILGYNV